MKSIKITIFAILFAAINSLSYATEWNFDQTHTEVQFEVNHMVITTVTGDFNKFEGMVKTKGDSFENADVSFTVDIASIDTDNEKRDGHLLSDDFFAADKHPKMTFVGKSMKETKKNHYLLIGDLTIRGITKEVKLDVVYNGTIKGPWGGTRAGFEITGQLDRFDYGLKWDKTLETGGLVVSREVDLNINVQLIKSGNSNG